MAIGLCIFWSMGRRTPSSWLRNLPTDPDHCLDARQDLLHDEHHNPGRRDNGLCKRKDLLHDGDRFFVNEKIFSGIQTIVSVAEKIFSDLSTVIFVAVKIFSVTEKIFTAIEKIFSVLATIIFVVVKILSVT
jgi:hypothetical protein